jgi:hypothetical protein
MHFYQAKAEIAAPPERVWAILTDAAGYPSWDPGIDSVEGTIAAGETITVHAKVNPGREFPVKVSGFDPPSTMTWVGGMPLGLFVGTRTFNLVPDDAGGVVFTMREEYHGPLVGMIWGSMPDLQPSFDEFAAGLKARAES